MHLHKQCFTRMTREFEFESASMGVAYELNFAVNLSQTGDSLHFGRHDFVLKRPDIAVPCLIVLVVASVVGTLGNLLVLIVVASRKNVRDVEAVFIVNLAIADLYVTMIADPMSIVAKLEGESFFNSIPNLCQVVASLCTVSCVTSLLTISAMSFNRYIFICKHEIYNTIFTRRNSICLCISLYSVGSFFVLLNMAGIGDHKFDRKSLECIWDRMATFPYTVFFSVVLVWVPCVVTGSSYLQIFLYVRSHRRKIMNTNNIQTHTDPMTRKRNLRLAKTLFIIYTVFATCWIPYALLIVIDSKDQFSHELHIYITTFAHLHPSLNWLIYYLTNKRFADAYKQVLWGFLHCRRPEPEVTTTAPFSTNTPYTPYRCKHQATSSPSGSSPADGRLLNTRSRSGSSQPDGRLLNTTSVVSSKAVSSICLTEARKHLEDSVV